ncbi:MAG: 50S ribosomal protein L11 methyltransferase [Myxococcales bacterium]|nr:50S ribosomal protein L11 methyltransferase [Myxococcales bacterium]
MARLRRLSVEVPAGQRDAAEAWAWGLGVQGLEVRDAETGRRDGRAQVIAWLDAGADVAAIEATLRAALPAAAIAWALEDASWAPDAQPVRVGAVIVAPPGAAVEAAPDAVVLRLDPALAFGDGAHPTTALCIEAVEQAAARGPLGRVLDVGTGTGVLGLLAALRGAEAVVAVDVDPAARAAAAEHAAAHGVRERVRVLAELPPPDRGFDLVLANVYVEPLRALAEALVTRTAPGGRLVLSGLGRAHVAELRGRYEAAGSTCVDVAERGDWARLILARTNVDAAAGPR